MSVNPHRELVEAQQRLNQEVDNLMLSFEQQLFSAHGLQGRLGHVYARWGEFNEAAANLDGAG